MDDRRETRSDAARRKYVLTATLLFSLVQTVVFTFMIWPEGMHTGRDVAWFFLLLLIAVGCGLVFSLLTWNALKGWFAR